MKTKMVPEPLEIKRVTVKEDRVVCDVAIDLTYSGYTSPELIEKILVDFPELPKHTCKNSKSDTFGAIIESTSIPHLLEHMVIDLQVRENPSHTYLGTTEWISKSTQRARIEVNFTDDLNALRAFRNAAHFLNAAMV